MASGRSKSTGKKTSSTKRKTTSNSKSGKTSYSGNSNTTKKSSNSKGNGTKSSNTRGSGSRSSSSRNTENYTQADLVLDSDKKIDEYSLDYGGKLTNILLGQEVTKLQSKYSYTGNYYSIAGYYTKVNDAGKKVRNDATYNKDYLTGRYGAIPVLEEFDIIHEE